MTPLTIAMLSVHSSPLGELGKQNNGGMSVYIIELAAELEKLGHHIDIFTLRRPHHRRRTVPMGARTRLVHLGAGDNGDLSKLEIHARLGDFFSALENFRLQEGRRYDLVHSHYWLSAQVGEWAQARWALPHVVTYHSLGIVKKRVLKALREPDLRLAVERRVARSCDGIIVPTRRELRNLVDYCDADGAKMTVIPCGVNLDRFRPHPKTDARRRLNLGPDEAVLLYVGRFSPEKGLGGLLGALPLIDARFKPHLVIAGGDGARAAATLRLQKLIRRLGLAEGVTFAGRIPNAALPLYYSAADLTVLPSLYESFGLVALESLACGTPLVSTPVGALEHVILEEVTGRVVADPGPPALARGINQVLGRMRTGNPCRQSIRASVRGFDWADIAAAMSRVYLGLAGARKLAHQGRIRGDSRAPAADPRRAGPLIR